LENKTIKVFENIEFGLKFLARKPIKILQVPASPIWSFFLWQTDPPVEVSRSIRPKHIIQNRFSMRKGFQNEIKASPLGYFAAAPQPR
jgi:hypothetical protein